MHILITTEHAYIPSVAVAQNGDVGDNPVPVKVSKCVGSKYQSMNLDS